MVYQCNMGVSEFNMVYQCNMGVSEFNMVYQCNMDVSEYNMQGSKLSQMFHWPGG